MSAPKISDIQQYQELLQQARQFKTMKQALPVLSPALKLMGVDTNALRDSLDDADKIGQQIEELAAIPDTFNDLFSQRGWILYDRMNLDVVRAAIKKAQEGSLEDAENELVNYYNAETVEWHLRAMHSVNAFYSRISLAEKALIDYNEERYHACVPVVLALLDGMVNEIHYKKGLPARGFFAEGVELTAWNSVAGHSKGLTALVKIFQTSRTKTVSEPIQVPFRNGILHGMDLGYDNKTVAAKVWAALFATRDWAVKAEKGLLEEQPKAPEPTWSETIETLKRNEIFKNQLATWQPRTLQIGSDIPANGAIEDYELGSPEHKLVEYLSFWKTKNFGRMAQCLSHLVRDSGNKTVLRVREMFDGRDFEAFEIVHIEDEAAAITTIQVRIQEQEYGKSQNRVVIARMIHEDANGAPVIHGITGGEWFIIWYGLNHYPELEN